MRKILACLILGCLIITLVVVSACVPAIPHSIEGRPDCISCHSQNGVKPYPEWHAKRELGNDACASCHSLKTANEDEARGS